MVWRWAVAIIIVAAVARVGWAAWIAHAEPGAVRAVDTPSYLGPARAMIDAGRFTLSPADPTPMFVRTPGYPAFLVPILWLTDSEWAISPIQAVISLLGVVAIVWMGWRLVGLATGLIAGVLLLLDPLQFRASGTILTEGVATVTMVAIVAVGVLVFAVRRPREVPTPVVLGLGALVAAAAMVRPTMWFYPVMLLTLLAARFRRLGWRALLARLLAFALPIVVVLGGWQIRNHNAVGSWQLSGAPGLNLYCSNAAEIEARQAGISFEAARRQLGCPTSFDNPEGICTSTVGSSCRIPDPDARGQGLDEWSRRGLAIMRDHPFQTARIMIEGMVRQVTGPGTDTVRGYFDLGPSVPLTAGLFLWNAALWTFAVVGAVAGFRSKYRSFWVFMVTTIGYVILVSAGDNAGARYRSPVIPLLALLAALGIRHVVGRVSRAQRPAAHVSPQQLATAGRAG